MRSGRSDGLLLVDKPAGMTSHDVVDRARRALGERRIGHAGTLDPFATGLLVLLVGRATRLLPYVEGEPKVYEATIRFGVATDTDDVTGKPVAHAELPERDAIERRIEDLTGALVQRPPSYSAKQLGGRRAYAAARAGAPLELPPVAVHVQSWRVTAWRADEIDAEITCGGGTYVRALARDLGASTGSAAHLASLRRLRSGRMDVETAVPIDQITEHALRSSADAMPCMRRVIVDAAAAARITRGLTIPAPDGADGTAAVIDEKGELAAIAEASPSGWQPRVVLRDA